MGARSQSAASAGAALRRFLMPSLPASVGTAAPLPASRAVEPLAPRRRVTPVPDEPIAPLPDDFDR